MISNIPDYNITNFHVYILVRLTCKTTFFCKHEEETYDLLVLHSYINEILLTIPTNHTEMLYISR